MLGYLKFAPARPALDSLVAALSRLVAPLVKEQRKPHYPCEIERLHRDLERKRAHADLHARFKAM